ncbi:MAG TPA: hypothetical protein DEQ02_01355, partial [Ruminococcaceae bacterium]|nr:hypothetical protein [Oscillospiraceae bacterium]
MARVRAAEATEVAKAVEAITEVARVKAAADIAAVRARRPGREPPVRKEAPSNAVTETCKIPQGAQRTPQG